jgi:hypothetical protein
MSYAWTRLAGLLRKLDRAGLKPRNVNKHRQTLSAIFNYGCRDDTYQTA